jgi:hypothetical protein
MALEFEYPNRPAVQLVEATEGVRIDSLDADYQQWNLEEQWQCGLRFLKCQICRSAEV